jgi:hypothetical protein
VPRVRAKGEAVRARQRGRGRQASLAALQCARATRRRVCERERVSSGVVMAGHCLSLTPTGARLLTPQQVKPTPTAAHPVTPHVVTHTHTRTGVRV